MIFRVCPKCSVKYDEGSFLDDPKGELCFVCYVPTTESPTKKLWCHYHGEWEFATAFYPDKSKKTGYSRECREGAKRRVAVQRRAKKANAKLFYPDGSHRICQWCGKAMFLCKGCNE